MTRTILLNPGPVNLTQGVREALNKPDLCHREQEFSQLQSRIRTRLLDIYQLPEDKWAAILLTGSGTSAMESMLSSMVPEQSRVLVVENGVYGERLSKICAIHNISFEKLEHEWGQPIDPGKLKEALESNIDFLAVVHHETTTGRLNDIADIAEICRTRKIPLLLDGVSSFGAEEIRFIEWQIAACAATANKCIHGIPGAAFVVCRRDLLHAAGKPARTLYLDLDTYLIQQDKGATPFTQSVQSFYALDEALDEHAKAGGWKARRDTYQSRMQKLINGLHGLGIKSLLDEGASSCVLHTFMLPDSMDYTSLHDRLRQRGFIIYAGQGKLASTIFRISLMGDIRDEDIDRLLSSFKEIL